MPHNRLPNLNLRSLLYRTGILAAFAVFLAAGMLLLPLTGLQVDEVLFVYHLWFPERGADWIALFHHGLPTMMMTYLGALKSWLYAPLLWLCGTSVCSVRFPALALAAGTIALTGFLLRNISGVTSGFIGVWLLATDITFLFTAVFDWGPVVLQNLLLLTGLLLLERWSRHNRSLLVFAAGLVFGLALWDKALFFWNLSGMGVALLLVNTKAFGRALASKAAALFLVGLALGASPLIRYNLRPGAGTVTKNANFSTAEVALKANYFRAALNGIMAEQNFDDPSYPVPDQVPRPLQSTAIALARKSGWVCSSCRFPMMMVCIPLGLVFAGTLQRKWILFFAIAAAIAWTESALTKEAGGSIHHSVLIWPFLYGAASLSLAALYSAKRTWVRAAVVLIVAVLGIRGLETMDVAYAHLLSSSPLVQWSNADQQLAAALLQSGVKRIVAVDWGIERVVAVRTLNRVAVADQTFELMDGHADQKRLAGCADADCAIVTHPKERVVMHKAADEFARITNDLHLQRIGVQVIDDTHGTPSYEIFRLGHR